MRENGFPFKYRLEEDLIKFYNEKATYEGISGRLKTIGNKVVEYDSTGLWSRIIKVGIDEITYSSTSTFRVEYVGKNKVEYDSSGKFIMKIGDKNIR